MKPPMAANSHQKATNKTIAPQPPARKITPLICDECSDLSPHRTINDRQEKGWWQRKFGCLQCGTIVCHEILRCDVGKNLF